MQKGKNLWCRIYDLVKAEVRSQSVAYVEAEALKTVALNLCSKIN